MRLIVKDVRESYKEVSPFVSQVNIGLSKFLEEKSGPLWEYIHSGNHLKELVNGVLEERNDSVTDQIYFLKQKHLCLQSSKPDAVFLNVEELQEEKFNYPKVYLKVPQDTSVEFITKASGFEVDGIVCTAKNVEEAELLMKSIKSKAGRHIDFQIETPIRSLDEYARLRKSGYSRVQIPADSIMSLVRFGLTQGPYWFRDFFSNPGAFN